MKKVLTLIAATFLSVAANAQLVTTTSFKRAKSDIVWYAKAGLNISSASFSEGLENPDSKIGYNLGVGFDKPIGQSGLFWGSGLQLATKGWKTESKDEDYFTKTKFTAHKLEIPLSVGYKYQVNDDIAIDARFGGFVNYDLFGKMTIEDEEEKESINLGDLDDLGGGYSRFGAGIQFGIGAWYQHFNFNITYQHGLVEQGYMKERNWMLSLGYAF